MSMRPYLLPLLSSSFRLGTRTLFRRTSLAWISFPISVSLNIPPATTSMTASHVYGGVQHDCIPRVWWRSAMPVSAAFIAWRGQLLPLLELKLTCSERVALESAPLDGMVRHQQWWAKVEGRQGRYIPSKNVSFFRRKRLMTVNDEICAYHVLEPTPSDVASSRRIASHGINAILAGDETLETDSRRQRKDRISHTRTCPGIPSPVTGVPCPSSQLPGQHKPPQEHKDAIDVRMPLPAASTMREKCCILHRLRQTDYCTRYNDPTSGKLPPADDPC
ncbi:hypothetical protein BJV77DRAFT_963117 [Russula vinacea]|nr:hypothetical protein BJV77DRAFT_963117 [Russula vinacea]